MTNGPKEDSIGVSEFGEGLVRKRTTGGFNGFVPDERIVENKLMAKTLRYLLKNFLAAGGYLFPYSVARNDGDFLLHDIS